MNRSCAYTIGGRADLLRILAEAPEGALDQAATLLGYETVARSAALPSEGSQTQQAAQRQSTDRPAATSQSYFGEPLAPVPFWRLMERQRMAVQTDEESASPLARWTGLSKREPQQKRLCPWPSLLPRLRKALTEPVFTRTPDIPRLVRLMSRGEPLTAWPRKRRRHWPQRLRIMEDFATRLTPIWRDQKHVSADLARLLPHAGTQITRLRDGLANGTVFGAIPDRRRSETFAGVSILVMGDLGILGASPDISLHRWTTFALERKAEGCRCIALTPAPLSAYPEPFRKLWSLVQWEEAARTINRKQEPVDQANRLLGLLSHHMKIPPGLLRDVRCLYPEMSASTEIRAWRSPHIISPHPMAATLSNAAKEQLHWHFRAEPIERKREIYRLIRKWCGGGYDSVYFEAVLSLGALAPEVVEPGDFSAAVEFIRDMAGIVDRANAPPRRLHGIAKPQVERYFREMRGRVGNAPKEIAAASEAYDRLSVAADDAHSAGFRPGALGDGGRPQRSQRMIQRSGSIYAAPVEFPNFSTNPLESSSSYHTMSPLADIATRNGVLAIWETPFWRAGAPPNWASDYGTDEFGPWVEFTIADADGAPVRQRMRWAPPGSFMMGSPEDEPGRYSDEGPRHEVRLSRGYWLFDVPVMQALWQAVMGQNPSYFVEPARPVEQVSWDDAVEFLRRINALAPGLDLILPTEAQWEYACRAGTDTATYAGPMEILGEHNAPVLDDIAWYGGNSGVDFDLLNGIDSSWWSEKQHEHHRAGTRMVGMKTPNAWGLYDMLGNVWEWCADEPRDYEAAPVLDPAGGPAKRRSSSDGELWANVTRGVRTLDASLASKEQAAVGAQRALRGGSWFDLARLVRAAYRSANPRDSRNYRIGFRCARVREGAEPAETGPGRAERQPAPARSAGAELFSFDGGHGEPMASLPQGRGFIVRSDCETLAFEPVTRPDWASAIGRDRHGLWVEFTLGDVTQRMRWIAPGRFLMGSPDEEEGRFSDEGPRHEVMLTKGYWLCDTPVTQALWQEVMGDNPSRFKDPVRPVESVSWDDAQRFLAAVEACAPGLALTLPTEAQWEYACRAGTQTETYAGAGEAALDQVAWYGENSKGETQPVKRKQCNDWGLHEMLGNVFEWCADDVRTYSGSPAEDPVGAPVGAQRALRGGSWFNDARHVRAADRFALPRDYRDDGIGFRCARVRP